MSHHELAALELLARYEHGPSDLARHLGVTSAAASGIVDRLVARGHVERVPHPDDGRRTQVVMTDSGRAEVIRNLQPMFVALAGLDGTLTPRDRAVVDRYLAGALAAIERVL
jgi:DNA-binding MarR family transcriptional regulator